MKVSGFELKAFNTNLCSAFSGTITATCAATNEMLPTTIGVCGCLQWPKIQPTMQCTRYILPYLCNLKLSMSFGKFRCHVHAYSRTA